MYLRFKNANEAFEKCYRLIDNQRSSINDTKIIYNLAFTITNPIDNIITNKKRAWKLNYAIKEWEWYLSRDRNVKELAKIAKIWNLMHSGDYIVNSNYGWQWNRNNQLDKIINKLKKDPTTRQACLSIYDGKEIESYDYDTPCTQNINFYIDNNVLNMSVIMRSNDLWFGFCNDQYCFSELFKIVAKELNVEVGEYYHYSTNMHLYKRHFSKEV